MELITVTVICLLPIPFDAFVVAIEQGSIDEFSVVFPDFACVIIGMTWLISPGKCCQS